MKKFIFFILIFTYLIVPIFAQDYYQCDISNDNSKSECKSSLVHSCQIYDYSYDGIGVPNFCYEYCLERSSIQKTCAKINVQKTQNLEAHNVSYASLRSIYYNLMYGGIYEEENISKEISVGRLLDFNGSVSIQDGISISKAEKKLHLYEGQVINVNQGDYVKIYLMGKGVIEFNEKIKFQIPSKDDLLDLGEFSGATKAGFFESKWHAFKNFFASEEYRIKERVNAVGVRG